MVCSKRAATVIIVLLLCTVALWVASYPVTAEQGEGAPASTPAATQVGSISVFLPIVAGSASQGPTETPTPLVVLNDSFTTEKNTVVEGNVLINDSGVTGVTGNTPSTNGVAVTVNADGSFRYTPPTDFMELDSFQYSVADSAGGSAVGSVLIHVLAPSQPGELPTVFIVPTQGQTMTQEAPAGNGATVRVEIPANVAPVGLPPGEIFYLQFTTVITPPGPTGGLQPANIFFRLDGFTVTRKLEALTFTEPLVLVMAYDPALLGDVAEDRLAVYYWDEATATWSSNGTETIARDLEANTFTARIWHLTEFGVWAATGRISRLIPFKP